MVIAESENLRKAAVQQMGMDPSKIKDEEFPIENFTENATKRVRLGVILNKIIEDNDLKSDAEVVKSLIDERSLVSKILNNTKIGYMVMRNN